LSTTVTFFYPIFIIIILVAAFKIRNGDWSKNVKLPVVIAPKQCGTSLVLANMKLSIRQSVDDKFIVEMIYLRSLPSKLTNLARLEEPLTVNCSSFCIDQPPGNIYSD
jgi:hypothetical protein